MDDGDFAVFRDLMGQRLVAPSGRAQELVSPFSYALRAASLPETPAAEPSEPGEAELAAVVREAQALWVEALGLTPEAFADVSVQVTNLPGLLVSETLGRTVLLDATAAGHGWFVDPTPAESSEFAVTDVEGVLRAEEGSAAIGALDLLTTIAHELGHVLGLEHGDAQGATAQPIMTATLESGVRIRPAGPAAPEVTALATDAGLTLDEAGSSSAWHGEGVRVARSARIGSGVFLDARVRVMGRAEIGAGSHIGAESKIGRGARIGERVRIGKGVTIDSGAVIPDHSVVLDGSQVGAAHEKLRRERWDRAPELRERLRGLFDPAAPELSGAQVLRREAAGRRWHGEPSSRGSSKTSGWVMRMWLSSVLVALMPSPSPYRASPLLAMGSFCSGNETIST